MENKEVKKDIVIDIYSELRPTYQLDTKTDKLVLTGYENVQEKIQSYETCALDKVLDAFLAGQPIESFGLNQNDAVNIDIERYDPLLSLAEIANKANELRDKLKLDPTTSIDKVFETAKNKGIELGALIKGAQSKIQNVQEGEKEDAKEITQESEH